MLSKSLFGKLGICLSSNN